MNWFSSNQHNAILKLKSALEQWMSWIYDLPLVELWIEESMATCRKDYCPFYLCTNICSEIFYSYVFLFLHNLFALIKTLKKYLHLIGLKRALKTRNVKLFL